MKHGPNRLGSYLEIHDTWMERLRGEGFVCADTLKLVELGDRVLQMVGDIDCEGGIVVTVDKYLTVIEDGPDPRVKTTDYSYNAKLSGVGVILRYCSPHDDDGDSPPHHSKHHKHCFDVEGPEGENETIEIIADDEWPTLGQVLHELRGWLADHAHLATDRHSHRPSEGFKTSPAEE